MSFCLQESMMKIVFFSSLTEDEWESCLQSKNESQIKKLIQENCIPSSIHLDAAYRIFERSSELLGDIFALVSEYIKKQSPHILRVYAAYDDRKNSESNYCFLVFTRQSEAGLKPLNEVYPIKIVRIEDCSEEDEDVVKEILMSHGPPVNISHVEINLNKVISDHSERLMKETKNITLITTSMYRSQNYQRGNPPCLVNDPCVVILVMHKNWIPIGSKPLPREINGIPVDVREGIAVKFRGKLPSEKHDNVRIGCKIESSGLPGSGHSSWVCNAGTLGGFILGSNSTIYGFTCAHILFPDKTLKEMQRDEKIYIGEDLELSVMKQKEEVSRLDIIVKRLEERKVYQASCEMDEYLGTVEMALYALGSTFDYTGVDFAVVKIDAERIPNTTEFPYVDDSGTFKRETEGASTERDFRFNSGKIIDEDLKCGEEVIKYGCRTLLTTGIFLGKRTFNNIDGETWYGQCEIVSNSSFAKESDSGSLVFRQKESDLEAACILLGGTRVRFAATYFPDILERTGLKDITFLKFDSQETKE
ncbi:uncharacterized protein LOC123532426 isoform X2 [Mercenaria mercenaria]|uniref:uncharacterized protein LOC123532426 isoform X2 n=1 Tax=Mercenaria mercenaria TaxID=6596 RepID=UPI00234FA7B5|nr:uncharacterized protein LOC123532426 isoform X2 [Mercenaria mercenaria]